MKRSSTRLLDWGSFSALTAAVMLFFAPTLAGGGVLFFGDVTNYALRLAYTGEWLKAGRFPLWNPLLSLGAPHAVDIGTQAFYPPHLLLSVLLGRRVFDYAAALHVLLAAVGTFALARTLGSTRPASLLAAIAYALSGFTFGHLQHLNVLVAVAWIPVVIVAIERYLLTSALRSLGLAASALGLFILGGHPQLVLYGLVTQGAYCVFRLAALSREDRNARLAGLVVGLLAVAAIGLGLAAVFLLPFAEWMRFVSRAERVTSEYATWYSLPPNRLFGLIAPYWLGGSPGRPQGAANLIEWSSYVGLMPLALAMVALARANRQVLFFLGLALVGAFLALGGNTPLYSLLLAVPVFGSVRAPARFLVLLDLSLALLAAFGLDTLRAGAGRRVARLGAILFLWLAGALARAVWVGERSIVLLSVPKARPLAFLRADAVRLDQADTVVLLFALLGVAALLWALAARDGVRRSVLGLVLLFSCADLLAFKAQLFFYWPAPPRAFEEPSRTAELIRLEGDTPRFYTQTGKELESLVFDRHDFEAYRRQMWESLRTSLPMRFGLQSLTGHLTEPPMHERLLLFVRRLGELDTRAAHVAGVFGVRYVIASPRRGISAPELTLVARGVRDLYRNELAMPRAYLVSESRVAPDEFAALRTVKRADFDPRRVVVIEEDAPSMPEGPLGIAQAAIVDEEPDRVVVRTASTRAAWLVLNDTFAPGWTASVDGLPATILRANALVRTVAVDPGFHRVEFVYAPASVRWGVWVSGTALAMVAFLVFRRGSPAGTGKAITA